MSPKTMFEKIWDAHVVHQEPGEPSIIYIDLHLVHEVTSAQAFDGLRMEGRKVRRTDLTVATVDTPFHKVLDTLATLVSPAPAGDRNFILMDLAADDGALVRYYIMSMGAQYHTLIFKMELPAEFRDTRDREPDWPEALPIPANADDTIIMQLRKRRVLFVNFTTPGLSADYQARIEAQGS